MIINCEEGAMKYLVQMMSSFLTDQNQTTQMDFDITTKFNEMCVVQDNAVKMTYGRVKMFVSKWLVKLGLTFTPCQ